MGSESWGSEQAGARPSHGTRERTNRSHAGHWAGTTTHSSVFRMRSVSGDGNRGMTPCNIPGRCKLFIFAVTASLWLQSHKAIAAAPPGSVDLLDAFRFRENSAVETSLGYCRSRGGGPGSRKDVAFKLAKKAVISVPTATVFPNKFPLDFSILTTFKSTDRGQLLTAYSSDGSLILSVRIGRRIVLQYKGGGSGRRDRVRFNLKLDSGKWHRLGISVKGNSATAILDCNQQDTQEIKRNKVTLKTDGIILFGQEIDDQKYFDGDIQQLMIVSNPEAAYNLCQDYLPDCSEPTATEYREQHDDFNAGYRGADSADILDREGLSPQQYLEFTERERLSPPPEEPTELIEPTFVSTPGEPGTREPH